MVVEGWNCFEGDVVNLCLTVLFALEDLALLRWVISVIASQMLQI